jgi:asparaginyl-tRNA synthetase
MKENKIIKPPKSWKRPANHHKEVLQSDWYRILSKIEDQFIQSTIKFYKKKGVKFMMLPITTGTISSPMGLGSDSKPVKVSIQGFDTYLADSMQFFLEFACRINQKGAYYIAPSFRGELADERHLCQFYHSESEIVGNLEDVINLCEDYLLFLAKEYLKHCSKEINSVVGNTNHINDLIKKIKSAPRCSFDEALRLLGDNEKYISIRDGARSINSDGEKELMKKFGGIVWLTHFEHLSVPFYQAYDNKNKLRALNADLLMGIGETIGAGQRHLTGDEVKDALKAHNISSKEYEWYVNLKNEVQVQTSGFGLGVERFLLWLTQNDDIRDMQILPRFNGEKIVF